MKKRLFVGNLSSSVKENELREKFQRFGDVENVEMHSKRDDSGNTFKTFAYLDLNITQEKLVNCIKTYHGTKWKGTEIVVQVAKESYIQRIQREAKSSKLKEPDSFDAATSQHSSNLKRAQAPSPQVKVEKASSDEEEVWQRKDVSPGLDITGSTLAVPRGKQAANSLDEFAKERAFLFDAEDDGPDYPPRTRLLPHWERQRLLDFAPSKVKQGTGYDKEEQPTVAEAPWFQKRPEGEEKHRADNAKRLASLKDRLEHNKSQQQVLRLALTSVDTGKSSKKIIFDEDDDEDDDNMPRRSDSQSREEPKKFSLFEQDDSDADLMESQDQLNQDFRLRPQFEGKMGQKVFALQSRIGNDERFRLSERFLESDEDANGSQEEDMDSLDVGDERSRNMNILRDMFGEKLKDGTMSRQKPVFKDTSRLRFDPAKADSSKFEVKSDGPSKPKKKKGAEEPAEEDKPLPEVSGEQFYEVSSALKRSLGVSGSQAQTLNSTGFSLAQLFGQELIDGDTDPFGEKGRMMEEEKEYHSQVKTMDKSKLKLNPWEQTPFQHESSDEEDDSNKTQRNDSAPVETPVLERHMSSGEVVQEVHDRRFSTVVDRPLFFFVQGDRRLLEGAEFFKCQEDPETIRNKFQAIKAKLVPIMLSKRKLARRAAERRGGKVKESWRLGRLGKK